MEENKFKGAPKPSKVNIVGGGASSVLANKIADFYGITPGKIIVNRFSDGEIQPSFEDSVRGNNIFIVQSTYAPADNLLELLLLIDAAKRASANRIIAVMPYFGYARQDRKDKPRVSIGAKLVANLLTAAGVTRIITMDLHADQIQGFFDLPVDHLYSSTVFIPYLRNLKSEKLTICSPDVGGTRRAATYAKFLNADLAIIFKQRAKANVIEKMTLIGDVAGRDVILVDDICDTAGTLTKAADLLFDMGAASVRAATTHAILSGRALERIEKSRLNELIVTDSIPLKKESDKIKVLSIAEIFADVIQRVHSYDSISAHYNFNNLLS